MSHIKKITPLRLFLFLILILGTLEVFASGYPWRSIEKTDLEGIWRQVGVVVLDPNSNKSDPWYQAKQFFRFPMDDGFKHVLVNPDSQPQRITPTQIQLYMLNEAPTIQKLTWHSKSIGILKHPERPQQRIDFGLYLRDAATGPRNSPLKPKKGDLILVFYSYKDFNTAIYYRLLRKIP